MGPDSQAAPAQASETPNSLCRLFCRVSGLPRCQPDLNRWLLGSDLNARPTSGEAALSLIPRGRSS